MAYEPKPCAKFLATFRPAILAHFRPGAHKRSLNVYRNWYNTQRPMWLQRGRTPDEVWSGASMPIARPIRAHEEQPFVTVRRIDFRDDPELPKIEIHLIGSVRQAA